MKNRKTSALLLLVVYSLILMEILGFWVEYTGQVASLESYQPGVTYACLYLRDLSTGVVKPPFPLGHRWDDDQAMLPSQEETEEDQETGEMETTSESETIPAESQEMVTQEPSDPMEQVSVFEPVTEDYFKDALFIGDSRTVGLSQYGDLDQADFAAEVGLTVFRLFDKKFLESPHSPSRRPAA